MLRALLSYTTRVVRDVQPRHALHYYSTVKVTTNSSDPSDALALLRREFEVT